VRPNCYDEVGAILYVGRLARRLPAPRHRPPLHIIVWYDPRATDYFEIVIAITVGKR
jgi:hypothetical protein